MTGVPAPRDELEAGGGSLLSYVAQTVRRLEDSVTIGFRDVQAQLTEMPRLYVPRLELDRRFDDLTLDAGQERADRERGDRELAEQVAELRRQREADALERTRREEADALERTRREELAAAARRTDRWQRIALSAGVGASVFGTVTGLVVHFT